MQACRYIPRHTLSELALEFGRNTPVLSEEVYHSEEARALCPNNMDDQRSNRNVDKEKNENPVRVSRKFIRIFYNLCLATALIATILYSLIISTVFDNDLSVVIPVTPILLLALIAIGIIMNVSMTWYFRKHPEKEGSRSSLNKGERAAIMGLVFGTISMVIAFAFLLINL